jgi:hypothetical protein
MDADQLVWSAIGGAGASIELLLQRRKPGSEAVRLDELERRQHLPRRGLLGGEERGELGP